MPALVIASHRAVKFSGSLYSWDGLGQEQASPNDGARKGDGDKEGGASGMGRVVEHSLCPQLVHSDNFLSDSFTHFFCQEISFCIDPKAQGARFPSPCLVYSCVFPTVEMCWSQIHEYPWYSSLLCLGMDEGRGANSTLPWTSPGPKWPSHHPGADPVLIN